MSGIRLKYSGLVNFASRMISVLTGLLFTMLVTRRLTEELFGTWQFYASLLSYFTIPSSIANYWLTRFTGRGKPVAKSGVLFNSMVSLVSAAFFTVLSPIFASSVSIDLPTILAFIVWIIIIHHTSSLESVCHGVEPHIVGYGTIFFETSKVVIGVMLVGYFRLSLFGAVLSVDLALIIQALYYSLRLSKHLKGSFLPRDVGRWFRMGWIPLASIAPGIMYSQDALVLTLLTGSLLPVAYIRAANIFAGVILFAGSLAIGLYPKLLSGGTGRDIEESLELVLLFLIPMTLGQLILAEPLLYLLREGYGPVHNVLRIMTLCSAITVLKSFFSTVILGVEKIDVNENASWKKLVNSYLIRIPFVDFSGSIVYITITAVVAEILNDFDSPLILFSMYAALCYLLVNLFIMSYYLRLSRRLVNFSLDFRRVSKLFISGIVMSSVLLMLYPESAKSGQIMIVLTSLMPVILVGIIVYFTALCLLDRESREMFKTVLSWFLSKKLG
ncbi:MAG: hypothetical protein N3F08_05535 [Crenarchaeota archaeon]|nr:hypothetical protein [Thermoproteota archaeon]